MRLFVFSAVLLASATASAGAYVEMEQKDLEGGAAKNKVNKLWADGDKLRLDSEGSKNSMIFKGDTMYAVDHDKKRVSVIDKQTMEQASAQMQQMQAQMKERMAQMPPEQRAQMEKAMAQHGGMGAAMGGADTTPPRTYKETSRAETVGGKPCKVWEINEGAEKVQEMCVAPMSAVNGGAEVIASLKNLGKTFEKMTASMGAAGRDRMSRSWAELDQVKGFPVLVRDFDGGKAKREQRLVTSRSEMVPPATFEPPADYKVERPEMGGKPGKPH
jgi:hypothetical protein